jgi:hypothetical protein
MDNVQNCDSYINIPSSQTYGSYLYIKLHLLSGLSSGDKIANIVPTGDELREGKMCYRVKKPIKK